MKSIEYLEHYGMFCLALFIMAFGIAFSVKANLGISPISCPPFVLNQAFPSITIGQFTIAMHVVFVIGQIILLRRDYQPIQLLQLVVALVFGFFTDFAIWATSGLQADTYPVRLCFMLISCVLISVGVFLQVSAKALLVAGEGIMLAISKVVKKEFGKVKMCFDCSLVFITIIFSLIHFNGEIRGVREGTVIAAFLVGFLVTRYNRHLAFIPNWIVRRERKMPVGANASEEAPASHLVITIARQYGSGGHEIGERLAKELGLPFYDNKIIDMVAEETGFTTDFVRHHEQNIENPILQDIVVQNYLEPIDQSLSSDDQLFVGQSRVLRRIAQKESCVVVGRCADYVLADLPNVVKVFVYANDEFRAKRVANDDHLSLEKAAEYSNNKNEYRANHYMHYTGKEWGAARNYDITICSSTLGIDGCVNLLKTVAEAKKQ